jgi:hypothetical protein
MVVCGGELEETLLRGAGREKGPNFGARACA